MANQIRLGVAVIALAALLVLGGALALFLFSSAERPAGEPFSVCTPHVALYDWVRAVLGDAGEVHLLGSKGGDPHHFEPSLEDLVQIGGARVLVVVGLGLDPWSHRAVEGSSAGKGADLWEVGSWVETRKMSVPEHEDDHDHEGHEPHGEHAHDHGGQDPHVWLDPARAMQIVRRLGDELARLIPARAAELRERAARYAAELDAFSKELDERARPLAGKRIVTLHDGYGYLLERCKVELAGVVQISGGVEPSVRDVTDAAKEMKEIGQQVVFAEPGREALAQRIAEAIGGRVALLDPIETPTSPAGSTYMQRLRHNVDTLVEHLR